MTPLEQLVVDMHTTLHETRTRDLMISMKRQYAKEQGLSNVPTNMQILKTYWGLLARGEIHKDAGLEKLLRKRSVRSQSGIVAIQVLTKPFRCPGRCIFCPNDATMPKSYINTQPGAMRALLNQFDPYKQVYNRLLSLTLTGHPTDKIEMIVLGGTWDVYPRKYKTWFVKGLYDACNHFHEFMDQIEIDFDNPKAARYTTTDELEIAYPETIEQSITTNETANCRIIGLTVETRPEYVTDKNCQYWRTLGVTRMEMGIQTLHNDVHEANKRGHGNEEIKQAMHKLRQYGFKISNHYMPGLYKSSFEKDIETFQIAFSTPWIKSDELKFYPTAVIPNTELYELYKQGEYEPLTSDKVGEIVRKVNMEIMPPYARIKRLARDFDTNEVVAGANTPNLRQLLMKDMQEAANSSEQLREQHYPRLIENGVCIDSLQDILADITKPYKSLGDTYTGLDGTEREIEKTIQTYQLGGQINTTDKRNFVCLCTRCREVRQKDRGPSGELIETDRHLEPFLVIRRYQSSVGVELFISFEDELGYLRGFTRLLLPKMGEAIDYPGLGEGTALIRELHVYGNVQRLAKGQQYGETKTQHTGLGTQLMQTAERISKAGGYEKISVISGVGVRGYYAKLGYDREGTYMVKLLG